VAVDLLLPHQLIILLLQVAVGVQVVMVAAVALVAILQEQQL
jgi:hypothetical protein